MFSWPNFIVTTAVDVRIISGSGERVVHSGMGLYYGLSWSDDNIYLLARDGNRKPGHPDILILDREFVGTESLPGDFIDGHQVHCDGESLYITSTHINAIEVVDLSSNTVSVHNWTPHTTDKNHINSIWQDVDGFWVGYHSWYRPGSKGTFEGGTKAVKIDSDLAIVLEEHLVGHGNHNVVRVGNELYICSSGDHTFLVYDLVSKEVVHKIDTGYWVRGLGVTDEYIVLGATSISEDRAARLTGDSEVHLLDRKTLGVLDKRVLAGTGSIYELRLIGCVDHAHNGIEFPGRV